jgi:hypothetical protein
MDPAAIHHRSLPLVCKARPARRLFRRLALLLGWVAAIATATTTAHAQLAPPAPAAPSPSPVAASSGDPILIAVDQFGVGESVRPGSWAGIRLRLTNQTDAIRAVAVRLHLRDDDGDTALYTRTIILNARSTEATWLYAPMPWDLVPGRGFIATVHEFNEGESTLASAIGRQLAATRILAEPATLTPRDRSMIGIVGQRSLGLNQYELVDPNQRLLSTVHEVAEVRPNINPALLPDSWLGLAPFETIVWTDAEFRTLGSREDPRAQALIEWVHRGGHLVIVMPPLGGDVYTAANPLLDLESTDPRRNILPIVRPIRHEEASLEPYRGLLTTAAFDDLPLPARTPLHTFEIPETAGGSTLHAIPLFRGPDGAVAVRRIVGTGMVTVVGLNLFDVEMAQFGRLRADAFWNRVLGKRVDVPIQRTTRALGGRDAYRIDGYIELMIARPAAAGVGVILALIVFSVYWVLAGPGGFGLLKLINRTRLAWVAFIGTIGVFTLIGWAVASLSRPSSILGNHVTFLDHVYGSSAQRARMWSSLFLNEYGEQTIAIESPDAAGWHNALTTWSPLEHGGALEFPDARPYPVAVRQLDRRTLPARSTTKDFQIDWLGRSPWRMPGPVAQGWEPRLEWPAGSLVRGVDQIPTITGRLAHNLPGPLKNVSVVLVTDQISESEEREMRTRGTPGLILSNAYMAQVPNWAPEQQLDLATVFAGLAPGARPSAREALSLASATQSRFRRTVTGFQALGIGATGPDRLDGREANAWEILSLYGMLPPMTDTLTLGPGSDMRLTRSAAHGLDLSAWITQPCVIIIGTVDDAEAPIPIVERRGSEERPIAMKGTTIVRWIYPLQPRPVRFNSVPTDPDRARAMRESGSDAPAIIGQ